MALKGNLHDFSFTQLLNLIHLARKTGTLAIDGKSNASRVAFREGKLIHALSTGAEGRLVNLLIRAGKITADQGKQIPENKTDRELGVMLVQAGLLTKQDLDGLVRNHVREVVDKLFVLSEGYFRFEPNILPDDRIVAEPPISLDNIIMEGTRRLKESERLHDELPNLDITMKFTDQPNTRLRNVNMSVEEWRVVSYINPKNTIRQIAQTNGMSEFQIRKIVYGMLQAGLIELIQPAGGAAVQAGRVPMGASFKPEEKRSVVNRLIDRIKQL
jgi:hypothetical protein